MWTKSLQSDTLTVGYQLGYYLGWYSLVVTSFEVSFFSKELGWNPAQFWTFSWYPPIIRQNPSISKTSDNDFQNPQWYFAEGKNKAQQKKFYN